VIHRRKAFAERDAVIHHVAQIEPTLLAVWGITTYPSEISMPFNHVPTIFKSYIGLRLWHIQSPYFIDATLFSHNRQA
jgi:hypothetical protein